MSKTRAMESQEQVDEIIAMNNKEEVDNIIAMKKKKGHGLHYCHVIKRRPRVVSKSVDLEQETRSYALGSRYESESRLQRRDSVEPFVIMIRLQ